MQLRRNKTDEERLFAGATAGVVAPGTVLFESGDEGDLIYIIDSGRIEISRLGPDGQRLISNYVGAGDMLGEVAALDGGVRTATAKSLTEARVRSIPGAEILRRVEDEPALALALIRVLCRLVRYVDQDMLAHATLTMRARLALRLLYLDEKSGEPGAWIKISQHEIAEFIGAARESVNKVLSEMNERGCIEQKRGGVKVTARAGLSEIAAEG